MRVSKWIVTALDTVGPEGREKKLAIVPSEALPPQRNFQISEGKIDRLIKVIKSMRGGKGDAEA